MTDHAAKKCGLVTEFMESVKSLTNCDENIFRHKFLGDHDTEQLKEESCKAQKKKKRFILYQLSLMYIFSINIFILKLKYKIHR
jgi:hypothetical protein